MKNIIISAVVGLLFMGGGFYYGLKLKPLPVPKPAAPAPVVAKSTEILPPPGTPITMDTLEKATESMISLNDTLKDREAKVAAREIQVQHREDEIAAERKALDRSHEQFKELYAEFQSRLNLVEANQVAQLQKQADLYSAMGTTQSIEIIRAMDDDAMTRLFSVMDTKPLAKLIAEWKTKYPADTARLLHNLDGIAQVLPKDKIALTDSAPAAGVSDTPPAADPAAPDPAAPNPSVPAPAQSTDNAAPAPASAPPSADPSAPPSADPSATPASDPSAPAAPAAPASPGDSAPAPATGPTADGAAPAASPASAPQDSTSTPTATATN